MARTGLGRGLDVLLGQPTGSATGTAPLPAASTSEIPLEKVVPNPQQPRTQFDPAGIEELAASIRRHGILQPIVVSRNGDRYELVAGHRRVLASRAAGKTTIPAVVREDVRDRLELALVENLQRADLNAIETARAYKLLMETYDLTQEQLADRVGKSRSHVANMLRTLSAPQPLQDAVIEGKISEGHLRALLPLPLSDALSALGQIIAKELSVRDAEALVRKMVHPQRRGRARARTLRGDPDLAQVTNDLRAALGTKVEIVRRRRGGRILIEFYSDEDFERLFELFVRAGRA
ncbi:MAG TPA: ParB/RepB/Spo0J family partition protein [Candidatus Limnocylindria bacterium]|nr:ParB/RepB/Spo0J family partition protein [Candidatus Limnocylindria bacterium]